MLCGLGIAGLSPLWEDQALDSRKKVYLHLFLCVPCKIATPGLRELVGSLDIGKPVCPRVPDRARMTAYLIGPRLGQNSDEYDTGSGAMARPEQSETTSTG